MYEEIDLAELDLRAQVESLTQQLTVARANATKGWFRRKLFAFSLFVGTPYDGLWSGSSAEGCRERPECEVPVLLELPAAGGGEEARA